MRPLPRQKTLPQVTVGGTVEESRVTAVSGAGFVVASSKTAKQSVLPTSRKKLALSLYKLCT